MEISRSLFHKAGRFDSTEYFHCENALTSAPEEGSQMSPDFVIGFGRQAIELCLMMALPMLGVGLGVGVVVSVIQAATQIQEMTLTFIPKIVCMFIALLLALPWLMERMITFTRDVFINIPTYVR